jgi:hypothetical protein
VVGDLDRLLPAYLERAYGALEAVEPSTHLPLPDIQARAAHERSLSNGFVGGGAKLHWLVPEPVLEDQHDETFDLLKDYLDWALYRQLRLAHGLSYGPSAEREVFGGIGFMSLNADLDRDAVPAAEQMLDELKADLLKNGLDAATFARLKHAAIARQVGRARQQRPGGLLLERPWRLRGWPFRQPDQGTARRDTGRGEQGNAQVAVAAGVSADREAADEL